MARIAAIVLVALFANALAAHPFDDRCDMVTQLILERDAAKKTESIALQVQYRYETPYASYNEAYLSLDANRDQRVTRDELEARYKQLATDLVATVYLAVRGEKVEVSPNYEKFAFANLDDPDATVDGPKGMSVVNLRIGYFFSFDVNLKTELGAGDYQVEFYLANKRVMVTDPGQQLQAWDDRGPERKAVTTVSYDRTPDRFDRLNFIWDIGEDATSTSIPIKPDKTTEPDKTPPPETGSSEAGKQQLIETDKQRHEEKKWFDRWVSESYEALSNPNAGLSVWLLWMGFMLILGGYHAVQPGHGKTLVASYLIGTQGTRTDALFLGIVVTAAHTSGVLLLMGGAWAASEFWPGLMDDPKKELAEWIALAVGATILLMGFGLVMKRSGGGHHEHDIFGRHVHGDHDHDHDHEHTHAADSQSPEDSDILEEVHPSAGSGQAAHTHDHSHSHDHDHAHGHSHSHDHGDGHHHHHDHELDPSKMTRMEILRLGILGGIVPCPSAFVIGLIFFSAKLYFAGLIMVIAFSFGLAVVLATIGLMLVHSKEYLNRKRKQTKSKLYRLLETKLPVFGALVITLIGTLMVVMALIRLNLIDPANFTV
ncbi:MAG: hypothetical protein H6839_16440 [Planctomycetes bacterium]|nr:hypothetical protein [Planctomycetota bacterium]